MKIKHFGTVSKGKLTLKDQNLFSIELMKLDGEVVMTVEKKRKSVSNPQMRYYRGVPVVYLGKFWGYPKEEYEEVHQMIANRFLTVEKELPCGRVMKRVKSTTELSTVEMEEYLETIRQWGSKHFRVSIPEPNETEFSYDVKDLKK